MMTIASSTALSLKIHRSFRRHPPLSNIVAAIQAVVAMVGPTFVSALDELTISAHQLITTIASLTDFSPKIRGSFQLHNHHRPPLSLQ
jgi:hypothetical protein